MTTPLRYVRYQTKDFKGSTIDSFLIGPGPSGELSTHRSLHGSVERSGLHMPDKVPQPVSAGYFSIELINDGKDNWWEVVIHGGLYHGSDSLGLKPKDDDAKALFKFLFKVEML